MTYTETRYIENVDFRDFSFGQKTKKSTLSMYPHHPWTRYIILTYVKCIKLNHVLFFSLLTRRWRHHAVWWRTVYVSRCVMRHTGIIRLLGVLPDTMQAQHASYNPPLHVQPLYLAFTPLNNNNYNYIQIIPPCGITIKFW